jgi:polygalacturonase
MRQIKINQNKIFMKNVFLFYSLIVLLFIGSCTTKDTSIKIKTIKVDVPFEMPAISFPDFSGTKQFPITDFGAVAGNQEKTSLAISAAIEKANSVGGASVIIPEGEWLCGKIHLKSNVNLHLDKGAVLLFSDNPEDYLPAVHTTWEGMECYNYSPLIYAYKCKNIAITGEGELKAKMEVWTEWFARPPAHTNSLKRLYYLAAENKPVEERQMVNDTAHFRPQFIQFNRCENVLMEGVTVTNSPFWTIHPYLSKNIVIRNIKVYAHGHNNDGIDPEMSQNVLIENCILDQGDDAISIKSGRNQDAWRLNTPSKNIVIRHLTVKNGHQLVALGSELSGGIENVLIDSCEVLDGAKLNHLLFIKTNERRGGFVRNIYMTNTKSGKIDLGILGIETNVLYQWRDLVPTLDRRLTSISDIYLKNIQSGKVQFVSRILGQEELPIKNISLENVHADSIQQKDYIKENVENFSVNLNQNCRVSLLKLNNVLQTKKMKIYTIVPMIMLLMLSWNFAFPQKVNNVTTPLHLMQPDYSTPYGKPEVANIEKTMNQIYKYLDAVTLAKLVDEISGKEITDFSKVNENSMIQTGDFRLNSYEWGVTYAGMLLASLETGNPKYAAYTTERLDFLAKALDTFAAFEKKNPEAKFQMERTLQPEALDDCGAIYAAMIKATRAGKIKNQDAMINNYIDYISNKQFRHWHKWAVTAEIKSISTMR